MGYFCPFTEVIEDYFANIHFLQKSCVFYFDAAGRILLLPIVACFYHLIAINMLYLWRMIQTNL